MTAGDVDSESTRFIASVEGLDIFLGASSARDGVAYRVSDGLTIAVGDRPAVPSAGTELRLSETVRAFLAE